MQLNDQTVGQQVFSLVPLDTEPRHRPEPILTALLAPNHTQHKTPTHAQLPLPQYNKPPRSI
jgi:hypothetical protein